MRAMGRDIPKKSEADILASAVERGDIGSTSDEWGVEDVGSEEKIVHPGTAEGIGHDLAGVGDAIDFGEVGGFLGLAEGLAVDVVEGHGMTPVIRWSAFCPPPTSVWESVCAP